MSERLQDIELRLLLEGIFLRYSHDFRNYSKASLKRRVLQALTRFDCPSISTLQERVLRDPALFAELLQFITIPVSEMFRDPGYFLALRQQVGQRERDCGIDPAQRPRRRKNSAQHQFLLHTAVTTRAVNSG